MNTPLIIRSPFCHHSLESRLSSNCLVIRFVVVIVFVCEQNISGEWTVDRI